MVKVYCTLHGIGTSVVVRELSSKTIIVALLRRFGYSLLKILFKLHEDLTAVVKPDDRTQTVSAISAPVVQHLINNPDDAQLKSILPQADKHKNQVS